MSSADSIESDIPSTYSYFSDGSEGDIQCTLTKSNSSNESENDPVSVQEISTNWQAPTFSEEERRQVIEECKHLSEDSPVIFPCDARHILQNNHPIEDRMRLIPVSVVFVSTFMGSFLDIEMQKPEHRSILLDVCAFSISKPIIVLSFSKSKESTVIKYNSRIARSIMMRINEDLGTNLVCIHGIIEEADFQSDERFIKRMEVVENDVKQFAVAVTLHMDRQKCSDAVKSFLKLIPQMSPKQNASGSTYGKGVKVIQSETKDVTVQNRKDFRSIDVPKQPSMSLTDRASQTDEKMSHIENAKSVIKRQKTTLKDVYSRFAVYLNKNRAKKSFDVNKSEVTDLELREVVDETTGILSNLDETIDLFSAEEKGRAECNIYDLVKNIIDDKNEMKKKLEQLTHDAEEKGKEDAEDKGEQPKMTAHNRNSQVNRMKKIFDECDQEEFQGEMVANYRLAQRGPYEPHDLDKHASQQSDDTQFNSPSSKISEKPLRTRKQQTFTKRRCHTFDGRTPGYLKNTQSQINRIRSPTKPSPTHVRTYRLRWDSRTDSRPNSVDFVGHAVSSNSPTSDVLHRQNTYHGRLTPKRNVRTQNAITTGTKLVALAI